MRTCSGSIFDWDDAVFDIVINLQYRYSEALQLAPTIYTIHTYHPHTMDTTLIVTIRALLSTDRRKSGQPESLVFQRSFEHRVSSEQFVTLIMNRTIVLLGQCVLHFETSGETLLGIAEQEGEVVFNMRGVILNEHPSYLKKMIGWGWQPVLTKEENGRLNLPIEESSPPEKRPTIMASFAKNPPVPLQHLQGI